MSKSIAIGIKKIQSFLASCKFNPNEPGPLKIIVDTKNPDYYENRAIELIQEAKQYLTQSNISIEMKVADYEDKIRKAIGLLTLAALMRQNQYGL